MCEKQIVQRQSQSCCISSDIKFISCNAFTCNHACLESISFFSNKKQTIITLEELAFDVLQIMNVFVAKMNGLRKYKKSNTLSTKTDNIKLIKKPIKKA